MSQLQSEKMRALHRDAARYRALRAHGKVVVTPDAKGETASLHVDVVEDTDGDGAIALLVAVRDRLGGNVSDLPIDIDRFADLMIEKGEES